MTRAAWWYRHQVARTLRRLEDPRWTLALAVAPDREGMMSRVWPAHLPRFKQGRGNLGDRMRRIFQSIGPARTVIIGSDIPHIEKHHIRSALAGLGSNKGVIGPASDGGYWLIGVDGTTVLPREFLGHVRWSTPFARSDTMATAAGWSWAEVAELDDVDTLSDLLRICAKAQRN
ncbi:hypothetical protein GCM10022404_08110 [Celeribacter arenosi]|uniref:Glycosyltransferase n=2 Tax=Celeribacter arenosi TaxID=792649 RepID=A0ABP7JZH9_9RHOB